MIIEQLTNQLSKFREAIYGSFEYLGDATMDLLDALSSNQSAKSVVELSLNTLFRRNYSSINEVIDQYFEGKGKEQAKQQRLEQEKSQLQIIAEAVPKVARRPFHLLATDVTPQPRPFAETLADRKVVHAPNAVLSNKPIAIGHEYSHLVYLPEKESNLSPPWVVPLSVRRVGSQENGLAVGLSQLEAVLQEPKLPFAQQLTVHVGDGSYSAVDHLGRGRGKEHENLVKIARLRSNRTLYFQPEQSERENPGHPTWFGESIKLKDINLHQADQTQQTKFTARNGHTFTVMIKGWHNLLMRGKKNCPMHQYPLTLVCVEAFKADGKSLYKRPLWLIVAGERREELSLIDIWTAYGQRYDIEHYFRFGKQRLLMSSYQTPDVEHEENWWQLTRLAYLQLFLAAPLAVRLPRPWEPKNIPATSSLLSPSLVQRDFSRIIRHIGTPALAPKLRGISKGRSSGTKFLARKWQPIVFKSKNSIKEVITQTTLTLI